MLVNGSTVATAKVHSIGRDSMQVTLGTLSIMMFVDSGGRILSADVPAQFAHVTRVGEHRGADAQPFQVRVSLETIVHLRHHRIQYLRL